MVGLSATKPNEKDDQPIVSLDFGLNELGAGFHVARVPALFTEEKKGQSNYLPDNQFSDAEIKKRFEFMVSYLNFVATCK